jgi:hypothetical protein
MALKSPTSLRQNCLPMTARIEINIYGERQPCRARLHNC